MQSINDNNKHLSTHWTESILYIKYSIVTESLKKKNIFILQLNCLQFNVTANVDSNRIGD